LPRATLRAEYAPVEPRRRAAGTDGSGGIATSGAGGALGGEAPRGAGGTSAGSGDVTGSSGEALTGGAGAGTVTEGIQHPGMLTTLADLERIKAHLAKG
jgi:hypothetical protein